MYFMDILEEEKEYAREAGLAEGREAGRTQGFSEGRAKGIAEGKAEGVKDTRIETAKNLIKMSVLTLSQIAQATGLPEQELEELK